MGCVGGDIERSVEGKDSVGVCMDPRSEGDTHTHKPVVGGHLY